MSSFFVVGGLKQKSERIIYLVDQSNNHAIKQSSNTVLIRKLFFLQTGGQTNQTNWKKPEEVKAPTG